VYHAVGKAGLIFSLLFFLPVIALVVPWYLLFSEGQWLPLVVMYGGGFVGLMLSRLGGDAYEHDTQPQTSADDAEL